MGFGGEAAFRKCISPDCGAEFSCSETLVKCPKCGELLDVVYDWEKVGTPDRMSDFGRRWASRENRLDFSGVWRFRELLNFCPDEAKVTVGEGQTVLQQNDDLAEELGMNAGTLHLQYEGLNPSGSFKDNGMAAAFSHAQDGGGDGKRVCFDGKYVGVDGAVCACVRAEVHGVHRVGADCVRQAEPGDGLRRAHDSDCGRF